MLGNGDDARLHVVYIVAQMLMQGKGDGSVNFVFLHSLLHWYVSMFLGGQGVTLGGKLSQTAADAEAGVAWFDDIVDVALLGSLIGVGEELVVLVLLLGDECLHVLAGLLLGLGFLCIEHGSGTAGTHHGNLS